MIAALGSLGRTIGDLRGRHPELSIWAQIEAAGVMIYVRARAGDRSIGHSGMVLWREFGEGPPDVAEIRLAAVVAASVRARREVV